MEFFETVKQVRQSLEMSQEELAHALNVSYVTINRWENGKTKPTKNLSGNKERPIKEE